ncbi:peptide-methionine (S)-S-oxide reductase MsrA [Geobacter sp.]|uniref:peptide-methionine (S)-S-oxide reductase MsrA n=1 Tax=Geobacter sp. TaxID=46610 RepID=UPI00262175FD|nr:peptide-methionine (S)-S-oxide reductase MsrA [Geobacter sp.]
MNDTQRLEKATFAAGCFWGVEAAFRRVKGVVSTRVGYTGGWKEHPTYEEVCSGTTGHAEAVEVTFDPDRVSYDGLLRLFWECHDPTQLNRQGPDVGTNYRSAIFCHTAGQELAATASREREQQSGRHSRPIVTEITAAATFWQAEEYHQQYLEKRGGGSCHW